MSDGLYYALFSPLSHLNAGAHGHISAVVCTRLAPTGNGLVQALSSQRRPPGPHTLLRLKIHAQWTSLIFNWPTWLASTCSRILSPHHRLAATTADVKVGQRAVATNQGVQARCSQQPMVPPVWCVPASIKSHRFLWVLAASIADVGIRLRRHFSRPKADTLMASIKPHCCHNS